MVEKKIPAKEHAVSPKDPKGPADPGVKVDAGEEHRLKQAAASLNEPDKTKPSCLIPRFDGAILSLEWKDALWDKFVTAAPRPRTLSEQQYSDRKLRSRS